MQISEQNGFIDVHCHILPGVDDGAKDIEQTKEMMHIAYEEGIRTIIVTPHNYASHRSASPQQIQETIQQVNVLLKLWNLDICLYPGNEIFYRSGVAEQLEENNIQTMAGSRYVLVEFEPAVEYAYLRDGLSELIRYGYLPILAHAERYDCLYRKKERPGELKRKGVYIQVNASSLLEGWGSEMRKRSKILLKADCIDFIGTDAHSSRSRSPRMKQCAEYLVKKAGREKAEQILYKNPQAVLDDFIL